MADASTGLLDPLYSFIFSDDKSTGALSYDELQTRRKLAMALATRSRPFPKTIGEGITALGEAIGQRRDRNQYEAAEAAQRQRDEAARGAQPTVVPGSAAAPAPGGSLADAASVVPNIMQQAAVAQPPPGSTQVQPPVAPPQQEPQLTSSPMMASLGPQSQQVQPQRPPLPMGLPPGSMPISPDLRAQLAGSLANQGVSGEAGARPGGPGQAPPSPRVQLASLSDASPAVPGRADIADAVTGQQTPPPQRVAQAPRLEAAPTPAARPTIPKAPPEMPQPRDPGPEPTLENTITSVQRQQLELLRRQSLDQTLSPSIRDSATARAQILMQEINANLQRKYGVWHEDRKAAEAARLAQPSTITDLATKQQDLATKQRNEALKAEFGDIPMDVFTKRIEKSFEEVKALPQAVDAMTNVRGALDQGIFTGLLATPSLYAAKAKAALGGPADPRIAATESFQAYGKPLLAAARQAQSGGANISDNDMKLAAQAIAGDITLEGKSMRNVMDALERIQLQTALHHQSVVGAVAKGDPVRSERLYGSFGLPLNTMEKLVPPAAKQMLMSDPSPEAINNLNAAFKTPGLAEQIIMRQQQQTQ